MKVLSNKIRCKKCGDIIESHSVHDFKLCKCRSVGIDGGHDYLRREGDLEDFEELSECIEEDNCDGEYKKLDLSAIKFSDVVISYDEALKDVPPIDEKFCEKFLENDVVIKVSSHLLKQNKEAYDKMNKENTK